MKRYQGGIDDKTGSIDRGGVKLSIKQIETLEKMLDGSGYLLRGIWENSENLDRSRRYLAAIEVHAENVFFLSKLCVLNLVFNYNFKTQQNSIKDT